MAAGEKGGTGFSNRAKATIAALTAVVTLATGALTLRDQLFGGKTSEPTPPKTVVVGGRPADVTHDAEAKSRAIRVVEALKGCVLRGHSYDECNSTGTLAIGVGIGSGQGLVQVEVTSPATFVVTSRSESGHAFLYKNTVQGELLRTCTPLGQGGCPADGTW